MVTEGELLQALDALLDESVEARAAAARSAFDTVAGLRRDRVVLLGAGGCGRRALVGMRHAGAAPLAFADNNPARHGSTIDGIPVLSPANAAAQYGDSAVFVVTIWGANSPHRFAHSRAQLVALGCDVVIPFPLLFWKYPNGTLPHYLQDWPEQVLTAREAVRDGARLWADDASRVEYLAQVRFRLHADFDGLTHPVAHPQYFPDDLYAWRADEWIVDGGAYDGDTLRVLLQRQVPFEHLFACEPDPVNFAKLEAMVAALPNGVRARISVHEVALASASGMLHLDARADASSTTQSWAGSDTVTVDAKPLDRLLAGAVPTLVKLDIEGAEPEALRGARETIVTHAPVLAICVYHVQDHLWSIPLMLKSWRDDYAFYLRPHNEEGWDLVCYAVPQSRWITHVGRIAS